MFGYIRFILAYFVLLSHVGIRLAGKNIGVFAVVIFYILAGLVTSKVFIKIAPQNAQISYFVKDRFLRIYPAFFFAFALTVLFFCATSYLQPHLTQNLLPKCAYRATKLLFLTMFRHRRARGAKFHHTSRMVARSRASGLRPARASDQIRRLGYALATGSLGVYAAAGRAYKCRYLRI